VKLVFLNSILNPKSVIRWLCYMHFARLVQVPRVAKLSRITRVSIRSHVYCCEFT
jgi:hypothetical protein